MTRRQRIAACSTALLPLLCVTLPAWGAELGLPVLHSAPDGHGGQDWTLPVQALAAMTVITLLPALLLVMTSFTRIMIVLALMRQALGTGQTPSNQILIGLALLMTALIMQPTFKAMWANGAQPYMDQTVSFQTALDNGVKPLRAFMLRQTREDTLLFYAKLSHHESFATPDDVPFPLLAGAFLTSELKTAFEIGFLLYIPFMIIDLVVASVLMGMGMMMLSPMIISAPFKLLLFVLVDGWTLVLGTLVGSFHT
ncbi:MAG: flagellar biosynthesis protein FliP [Nevskiaceae bacterium]|nr:MAG: flagellar biosynthesis protein FliP [Nevskiaceae bacterium]TBR72189.1 MAG: flagellar biosynthesis protein FliP [Nevskiaceae bacterium]